MVRSYDLTTGAVAQFEGHSSWVLAIQAHQLTDDQGNPKQTWLFTASDDGSIRVWDIKKTKCLDELTGHKSGVTSITFINN